MSAPADAIRKRSVIVTGASRGLGAALFHALQADGARVFGLARAFPSEQQVLAARHPASVRLRATDLAEAVSLPTEAELAAFVGGTAPEDEVVLLHNAATVEPIGLVGELAPEDVFAAVQVNLVAPILLTNTFLSTFARDPGPRLRIVYVASSAAHRSYPGWATYCATKAGAEAFMRCVSEAASRSCTVEIVDPGAIETQMQRTLRERGTGLPGHARLVERHRVGDIADPATVAKQLVARHFPPLVAMAAS
ncbi:SDR family oxidoreductase [Dactylosporangium maewongense]|uniref:SDR family oxidoreductase n=1 Tax=Dactylosporangium maewongense TaxID=634393 RepID=A0ABP4L339_9ACTN